MKTQMNISIEIDLLKKLRAEAKRLGCNMSQMVGVKIEELVEQLEKMRSTIE